MKRQTIAEIIAALFILLFLYTALSKSLQIGNTVYVLEQTPFNSGFSKIIAWVIVISEYIVAALLFLPKTRKIGLGCSFLLMMGFTGYILYMKISMTNLPCSCGGIISKMTWNQHLVFNIVFCLLALIAISLKRNKIRHPEIETTQIVVS